MHDDKEDLKEKKNITIKEASEVGVNRDWAKENMSPIAMSIDQNKG